MKIDIWNNFILVGDPIRSSMLFEYNEEKNLLTFIAKDTEYGKLTNMKFFGEDGDIVETDLDSNVFQLSRNRQPENTSDLLTLQSHGIVNFGEIILALEKQEIHIENSSYFAKVLSKFQKPNSQFEGLFQYILDKELSIQILLFSTMNGTLGYFVKLPKKIFDLLSQLMQIIIQQIENNCITSNLQVYQNMNEKSSSQKNVKIMDYYNWRKIKKQGICSNNEGCNQLFVDGDILKLLLSMPNKQLEEIFSKLPAAERAPSSDILLLIESLEKIIFS